MTKKFKNEEPTTPTFPQIEVIQQEPKTHGFESREMYLEWQRQQTLAHLDWLSSSSSSSDSV